MMIFIGGRNLALSMLCNIIPPVGLLLFTYLTGKFNQQGYVGVRHGSNSYLTIYDLQPIFFFLIKQRALPRTRVSLNSKAHQLGWLKTKYAEFFKIRTNYNCRLFKKRHQFRLCYSFTSCRFNRISKQRKNFAKSRNIKVNTKLGKLLVFPSI